MDPFSKKKKKEPPCENQDKWPLLPSLPPIWHRLWTRSRGCQQPCVIDTRYLQSVGGRAVRGSAPANCPPHLFQEAHTLTPVSSLTCNLLVRGRPANQQEKLRMRMTEGVPVWHLGDSSVGKREDLSSNPHLKARCVSAWL